MSPRLQQSLVEKLERALAKDSLAELIAVWRECPAAELAVLIEEYGLAAAAEHPPVGGKTDAERDAAWRELAARGDVTALDRLTEALFARSARPTAQRLEVLNTLGPDPRIGAVVVRWLDHGRFASLDYFWECMFETARASGDPRLLVALKPTAHAGDTWIAAYRELKESLPSLPSLPRPAAALLAKRARPGAKKPASAPALLAAIYDRPDDDSLRQLYGDLLIERNDPRGELIALQYAKLRTPPSTAAVARERALLKQHGQRWLGAIGPSVMAGAHFERGFVAEVELKATFPAAGPEWATVHTVIDRRREGGPYPPLPGVRRAIVARAGDLEALAVAAPRLEELTTRLPRSPVRLAEVRRFVTHEYLRADGDELSRFLASELGKPLVELGVVRHGQSKLLARLYKQAARTSLQTLRLFFEPSDHWQGSSGWVISIERGGGLLLERLPDENAITNDLAIVEDLRVLPAAVRKAARFGRWEGAPLDATSDAALRALFPSLPRRVAAAKPVKSKPAAVLFPQLQKAIKAGKTSVVAKLLAAGAPVEHEQQTTLQLVLGMSGRRLGHPTALALLRLLLDAGADPNRIVDGKRPLTWAYNVFESSDFSPAAAELLMERGARADNETVVCASGGNSRQDLNLIKSVLARLDGKLDKRPAIAYAKGRKLTRVVAFLRAL